MEKDVHKLDRKKGQPLHLDNINWDKVEKIFSQDVKFLRRQLDNQQKERYPYAKDILKLLAAGAVIGLSVMIPALPMAIAPFIVDRSKYKGYRLHQTVGRLKKQKLVEIIEKRDYTIVKVTQKGRVRALEYKLEEISIHKPKVWDKKWRIVIFDIPEKYRYLRDIFRRRLKMIGFYQIQESVWVYPFPCFDQVEFLREIYNVAIGVRYIVAEKIENSGDLSRHFRLK